jgi:hypothetical protein
LTITSVYTFAHIRHGTLHRSLAAGGLDLGFGASVINLISRAGDDHSLSRRA